jgi:tetratricopeptide (TPR) repeat protein
MEYRKQIKQLMHQNALEEALTSIKTMEGSNSINIEEKIILLLLKSRIFVKLGKTRKGLDLVDKILIQVHSQSMDNPLLLVNALLTKIEVLRETKQYLSTYSKEKLSSYLLLVEECKRYLQEIEDLDSTDRREQLAALLRNKGLIHRALWQFFRAETCFQESLTLFKKSDKKNELTGVLTDYAHLFGMQKDYHRQLGILGECLKLNEDLEDQEGIAETFVHFARVLQNLGEPEKALDHIKRARELCENQQGTRRIAQVLFDIGLFYYNMRDDTASCLNAFEKSLALREGLDDTDGVQLCLHILGDVYQYSQGEYTKALQYYLRSITDFKQSGRIIVHCWNLLDMGNLYHLKGELEGALDHFQKAFPLLEDISDVFYYCQTFLHIGRVYRSKGENSKALDYYKQCLRLLEERNLGYGKETEGLAYYEIITLMLDDKKSEEAIKYFERFTQFYQKTPESQQFLNQGYKLAEALILKTSVRIKDKARAQQLFQEIIIDKNVKMNLLNYLADSKKTALLNLCELLLFELKSSSDEITGEHEIFQEVKLILSNLASRAQEQLSFPLLVDVTILQAKLALIQGHPTEAMEYLAQAKLTAEECNLQLLYNRVITEENHLKTQLSVWETLIKENAPLTRRLAQAQVEEYLIKAKQMVRLSEPPSASNN